MSVDKWIVKEAKEGVKLKRKKFWTKKKILAVVLVAVIMTGFYQP